MSTPPRFAEIAALAGDPARAQILHALLDGRALTASELARAAGITPQTASGHLARMVEAHLLSVEKQGRHRYHRLASPAVAHMLEAIMQVAATATAQRPVRVGPRDADLRAARTCYDHLAGTLAVALADALVRDGHLLLDADAGQVTETGAAFFNTLGIDVAELSSDRTSRPTRLLCRPCLDWSERRPHIAGRLGAALCTHALADGWVRRRDHGRALLITRKGERIFRDHFAIAAPLLP